MLDKANRDFVSEGVIMSHLSNYREAELLMHKKVKNLKWYECSYDWSKIKKRKGKQGRLRRIVAVSNHRQNMCLYIKSQKEGEQKNHETNKQSES